MALTCCVTCGASLCSWPVCLAAEVLSERAWNTQCKGSVVSAPSLSDGADSACAVQAAPDESTLAMRDYAGEITGYAKQPFYIARFLHQRRLTPELSRPAARRQ